MSVRMKHLPTQHRLAVVYAQPAPGAMKNWSCEGATSSTPGCPTADPHPTSDSVSKHVRPRAQLEAVERSMAAELAEAGRRSGPRRTSPGEEAVEAEAGAAGEAQQRGISMNSLDKKKGKGEAPAGGGDVDQDEDGEAGSQTQTGCGALIRGSHMVRWVPLCSNSFGGQASIPFHIGATGMLYSASCPLLEGMPLCLAPCGFDSSDLMIFLSLGCQAEWVFDTMLPC